MTESLKPTPEELPQNHQDELELSAAPVTVSEVAEPEAEELEAEESEADEPEVEGEWWEDPSIPWNREPTRADYLCLIAMTVSGLISLGLMPLRAYLLGSPDRVPWLVALVGSQTGSIGLSSLWAEGMVSNTVLILSMISGALMIIKFDWIYWWAGKLWGRGLIESWANRSKRAQRGYATAERWAKKMGIWGIFIAYIPIPLPLRPVIFILSGMEGMRLRTFLLVDYLASLLWLIPYFGLGVALGKPAIRFFEMYAKVANYVVIGLVVLIIVMAFRNSKTQKIQVPQEVKDQIRR
ncbi:DedA family protein [Boudabousia liubingyangii]|uniref:DedA family protein n=1 Tax=Boudabousia liubingyangii TaxID=1921764 RepID=UPI0009F9F494|nr:VTT domain-containing protein [Boudabousia liubingyangii]